MSPTVSIKAELMHDDISVLQNSPPGRHGHVKQTCIAAGGRHLTSSLGQQERGNSTPESTPQSQAANGTLFSDEEVLFELKACNAMRFMELCSDQEGKARVWELYTRGTATNTRESAAEIDASADPRCRRAPAGEVESGHASAQEAGEPRVDNDAGGPHDKGTCEGRG